MAATSKIEWTRATFNPWIGCTKIADGCTHCYAEADMDKRRGRVQWGPHGTRSKNSAAYWRQPLKWNAEAAAAGERRRVFCASLADVFEDWTGDILDHKGKKLWTPRRGYVFDEPEAEPENTMGMRPLLMVDLRESLFALIDETPQLDWLLLTKRPENIRQMWPSVFSPDDLGGDIGTCSLFRPNVWLGTSIATQKDADKNVPELLKCRDICPVLFLSAEPLLGPIDLCRSVALGRSRDLDVMLGGSSAWLLDWVIAGGESGPHARPMHPDWPKWLRDQCQRAGVPFFFKQWGEWGPVCFERTECRTVYDDGRHCEFTKEAILREEIESGKNHHDYRPRSMYRLGKKSAGRDLGGREWSEFPDPKQILSSGENVARSGKSSTST